MRAGQLRKRVQIQQNQPVTSTQFGGETANWVTVATVWGGFKPSATGSGEREFAQQQVAVEQTVVTIRYYKGLSPEYRLVMNGRTFAITAVVNVDERNRQMDCVCKELQSP